MARFSFRTLLNGQTFGEGFFEYPDALGKGPGTTVYQNSITAFGYQDREVGNFDLSNLNNLQFTIAATPTTCAFNIVMSTPDRLKSITAGPAQPGLLGPLTGSNTLGKLPFKLEWPTEAAAVPAPAITAPSEIFVGPGGTLPPEFQPTQPTIINDLPVPYASCISDCFTQMGRETRCFVLTTVKDEINNLIEHGNIDISQITVILNEIRDALDGDDGSDGLQAYVKLVNDIKFLMDNRVTNQDIVNVINNTQISNNNISYLVNNQTFINGVINNQQILAEFVNNSISKIINVLLNDDGTASDIRNQLIAVFNQLIIKQVTQVKQELNTTINNMRDEINIQIQKINVEISNIGNTFNGGFGTQTKQVDITNLQIQIDALNEKIKQYQSIEINPNIDLSHNITITNMLSQIVQINNSIATIKLNLQQYMSRNDFAVACETACKAFLAALHNPASCDE